jgi:hypothetical protein
MRDLLEGFGVCWLVQHSCLGLRVEVEGLGLEFRCWLTCSALLSSISASIQSERERESELVRDECTGVKEA